MTVPDGVTQPARVAFIAGPLGRGGAEQQLFYLLEGLDRARWMPSVIHVSESPDAYWVEPIRALGIQVEHVGRTGGPVMKMRRIAALLRAHGTDIVHSTLLYLNPYAAAAGRLAGTRVRIGSIVEDFPSTPQLGSPVWLGYYGCDMLIANFRGALRNIPRRVRASRRVAYSGVPESPLPACEERRRIRAKLGLTTTGPVMGAVGRIDDNKNFGLLITAFAAIASKWPDATLVIVGDGPSRAGLEALASSLGVEGRVRFPGRIPGSAQTDIFPAFDIACLSSIREGFPIALLEASMSGAPIVSTICGGTPEMVDDGVTGFLVANGDSQAMAPTLDYLLANPAEARAMGMAGRQRVMSHFGVSRMIESTMDAYEEALGAPIPA